MKNLAIALVSSVSLVGLVACAQLANVEPPAGTKTVKATKPTVAVNQKRKPTKRAVAVPQKRKPVVRPPSSVTAPAVFDDSGGGGGGSSSGWN